MKWCGTFQSANKPKRKREKNRTFFFVTSFGHPHLRSWIFWIRVNWFKYILKEIGVLSFGTLTWITKEKRKRRYWRERNEKRTISFDPTQILCCADCCFLCWIDENERRKKNINESKPKTSSDRNRKQWYVLYTIIMESSWIGFCLVIVAYGDKWNALI